VENTMPPTPINRKKSLLFMSLIATPPLNEKCKRQYVMRRILETGCRGEIFPWLSNCRSWWRPIYWVAGLRWSARVCTRE
jgi:hypothetical protein